MKFIVGKKYYVKKEDYEDFVRAARSSGVGSTFINSFKYEMARTLLSTTGVTQLGFSNGFAFDTIDGVFWYFNLGYKFFLEKNLYVQEEMEL